ncbi:hypothetical protein BSL78_08488 [Apostichopus japonicus]|uniref:Uncharacterized protein n=1 Tax=Stichopus japonicus TaxID=307972 RepID=A0A2G8L2W1_STIJA|nr:hypothetical protein BSL78_08488 [Apostichopus japonicus]
MQQLSDKLKVSEYESQQLTNKLKEADDDRQQMFNRLMNTDIEKLSYQLEISEEKMKSFRYEKQAAVLNMKQKDILLENLKAELNHQRQELTKTKSTLRCVKDELVQSQLNYAKETMALQEVVNKTRDALSNKLMVLSAFDDNQEEQPEEKGTSDISQESALAAAYGRLMVGVAEELTLDSTLRLASLFRLPPAEMICYVVSLCLKLPG